MRESSIRLYEIRVLVDWSKRRQLNLSPRFQRRQVWLPKYQSYFLDTLIRGYPTGLIHINENGSGRNETIREVVDGQQRLRSILDFYNNKITILPIHNEEFGGKKFNDLPFPISDKFLNSKLAINVLEDASDPEILDIFARLNTYTVKLNPQELRNAKYHGEFKSVVYELSSKSISFYINHKILTTRKIMRMNEAELISELLLAMDLGLQDKKKSLNAYYSKYDKKYPNKNKFYNEYLQIIDKITQIFGNAIETTRFKNKTLFYSLFCVMYDLYFGLPMQEGRHGQIPPNRYNEAKGVLFSLDSQLNLESPSSEYLEFVNACKSQTDNINPRRIRHSTIKSLLVNLIEG